MRPPRGASISPLASLADLALGGGLAVRRLSGRLLFAAPALIVVGLVRAVSVLTAVGRDAGWRDALGAFAIWLSLGWAEMALATLGTGVALLGIVLRPGWVSAGLAALLAPPVLGWLAAPAHSVAALRVDLPASLRRRREGEGARGWWRPRTAIPVASLAGAVGVVALLLGIVQPGSHEAPRSSAAPSLPRRVPEPVKRTMVHPPATSTPTSAARPTPTGAGTGLPSATAAPTTTAHRTTAPMTTAPAASPTATSPVTPTATRTPGSATPTARPTTVTGSPTASPTPSRRPTDRPTPTRP